MSTTTAARSSPSNDAPAGPRLTIQVLSAIGPPTMWSSASFAKTTSGPSCSRCARNRSRAEVPDRAPRREVDAHTGRWRGRARSPGLPRSGRAPAAARTPTRGDAAADKPRLLDLLGPEVDATPRSEHMLRSPRDPRARRRLRSRRLDRADALDPELEQAGRGERPASSAPRSPMNCALPPSAATQAATLAAWPPGRSTIREVASAPVASGCSSRTITLSTRSPRQQIVIAYDPRMDCVACRPSADPGGGRRPGREPARKSGPS